MMRDRWVAALGAAREGSVWGRTVRQAIELLYPPCCANCGIDLPGEVRFPLLCGDCHQEFTRFQGPACVRCAMPVKSLATLDNCGSCRNRHYYFDEAVSLGIYRDALQMASRRMKRPAYEQLTCTAGHLLAERIKPWIGDDPPDAVVPIPMHWLRLWTRGVNGAEVLAEVVGRELGVAVWPRLMCCRRRTRKQGTLGRTERFRNVRHAFRLTPGYVLDRTRVLLIDDVMTTGATASEVARVLRRAGAASVRVAVVGRGTGAR